MKLLHEFECGDRYAAVYLTSDGQYVVITSERKETSHTINNQEAAEIFAEDFVMKE